MPTSVISAGKALVLGLRRAGFPISREPGPASYVDRATHKIVIGRGAPGAKPLLDLFHEAGHLRTPALRAQMKADVAESKGKLGAKGLRDMTTERLANRGAKQMLRGQGVSRGDIAHYTEHAKKAYGTYRSGAVAGLMRESGFPLRSVSNAVVGKFRAAQAGGATGPELTRIADKIRRKQTPGYLAAKRAVSHANRGELAKSFASDLDAANREFVRKGLIQLNWQLDKAVSHFGASTKSTALSAALLRKILSP
jgi:hypothetical protein